MSAARGPARGRDRGLARHRRGDAPRRWPAPGRTVVRLSRSLAGRHRTAASGDLRCDLDRRAAVVPRPRPGSWREWGTPDIVVSNAGAVRAEAVRGRPTPAELDAQLAVNLRGALRRWPRRSLPAMRAAGAGLRHHDRQRRRSHAPFRTTPPTPPASSACAACTRRWRPSTAAPACASPWSRPGPTDTADLGPGRSRRPAGLPAPRAACCAPRTWPRRCCSSPPARPRVTVEWLRLAPTPVGARH